MELYLIFGVVSFCMHGWRSSDYVKEERCSCFHREKNSSCSFFRCSSRLIVGRLDDKVNILERYNDFLVSIGLERDYVQDQVRPFCVKCHMTRYVRSTSNWPLLFFNGFLC